MDRLTFEGNFCDIAVCLEVQGGPHCRDGSCSQRKCWERLKQYEDIDEQGRHLVLPCKICDKVFMIVTRRHSVCTPEYSFIKITRLTWNNIHRILQDFGKTVFLTYKEAKAALESMERKVGAE